RPGNSLRAGRWVGNFEDSSKSRRNGSEHHELSRQHDRRIARRRVERCGRDNSGLPLSRWRPYVINDKWCGQGHIRMNKTRSNPSTPRCKVFLVDDHPIVRQGLALFIDREPDLMVCGEADGATASLQAIREAAPDFVVLDISLDGPDGLELLKTLRVRSPTLPVLVLSMHDESVYAERALRAGANGYIMKQEATDRVLTAIRHILGGDVYLSDRLTKRMLQQFVNGSISPRDPLAKLSDRELEVYRLIGAGHGTRQIADELHVSTKTVESYQAHIKEKLALRNARELVQHAVEWSVNAKGALGELGEPDTSSAT